MRGVGARAGTSDEARDRRRAGALKLGWASTFFGGAVVSRRAAGLALEVAQRAGTLADGVEQARRAIADGRAARRLAELAPETELREASHG